MAERVPVSGTTRLYAVLGDPVAQVKAPGLMNPLFDRLGLDAVLVPVHVAPENLAATVRGLSSVENLDGLLVTVPHKAAARALADTESTTVTVTGTANAMRRNADGGWHADNFDGSGFVRGLRLAGHRPEGRRVSLLGAGGAGSAIAAALLTAGVSRLAVHDPHASRLSALLARLERYWPGRSAATVPEALGDADIVVNATPLGMRAQDPLPLPLSALAPSCLVADIIMEPRETALLRAAARRGHQVHHGLHMLEQQVDSYREFFDLR
ncbi:shikimate dehydrogenase [Streptomyces sp. NBC_00102]|uniref:shikimate dehydrogenase family protein n=1 Tax=Streptomyces sp. NBC_00102 TaxID=2975652 RepID=UPI00224FB2D0|nr:shikimate dehydrogenase [Streptomyces sp. NBC_00102]MCX5399868.1 shikimate dehydrogenase [Streptomyces sp. NBC_00102]